MNTSETQTNSTSDQRAKSIPTIATPLVLPGLVGLFGPNVKKVRFPDKETARRGFRVLYRSGRGVEALGKYTFGCEAPEQLELLQQAGIHYEIVE